MNDIPLPWQIFEKHVSQFLNFPRRLLANSTWLSVRSWPHSSVGWVKSAGRTEKKKRECKCRRSVSENWEEGRGWRYLTWIFWDSRSIRKCITLRRCMLQLTQQALRVKYFQSNNSALTGRTGTCWHWWQWSGSAEAGVCPSPPHALRDESWEQKGGTKKQIWLDVSLLGLQ